ncbi:hypothetical protein [Streptomyces bacillaris]|uniref:hypothetical protein n=1 Tax=Streptomyces bacillaris TaxID=68179 RepID=UPI003812DCE1
MRSAEEIMRHPFRVPEALSYEELSRICDDFDRAAEVHPSTGTGNSAAKLNEDKVRAIRQAADAGARLTPLAEAFGISARAARHIVRRTSWTHVQ